MISNSFYNLNSFIDSANAIIDKYEYVSFDLFDTLLIRRVHDPDMIKVPVARFIASKASKVGEIWTCEDVLNLRNKIESTHRNNSGMRHLDREARYPDFMSECLSSIFKDKMSDELLRQVTDYELSIENAMIVPRAPLVEWLKMIHVRNKKIFILSDIYLPSEHLRVLIKNAGLLRYVTDVISSADTFLAKASGKAFIHLKDRHNIEFAKLIHIGDNPISDGLSPSALGIRSFVINDVSEKLRKGVVKKYLHHAGSHSFWKGRALQQLMLPLEAENSLRPHLYVEGYNFFAPLVGAFVQGIAERTKMLGIEHIYFLSREGFIFKEYWDRAMPFLYPDGDIPSSSYLYVSRKALAGTVCAHQGLTATNAEFAFFPSGNKDFIDLCNLFSLEINPLKPFLKRHGLNEGVTISPLYSPSKESSARFKNLLRDMDFQDEIKKQSLLHNQAFIRYLESEKFFDHEDVALVDVGWLGTIPRLFYESIRHKENCPNLHCFLFGANRRSNYDDSSKYHTEGIIYDGLNRDAGGNILTYYPPLFEEAFKAHHPGLKGYSLAEDGFNLSFHDHDDADKRLESEQNERFLPLQQGIIDASARYGAAAAVCGYSVEDLKPWLNHLIVSKVAFPKVEEVELMKPRHHINDCSGEHTPPLTSLRTIKHLWDRSTFSLKWNPAIRFCYYIAHNMMELRRYIKYECSTKK